MKICGEQNRKFNILSDQTSILLLKQAMQFRTHNKKYTFLVFKYDC